MNNDTELTADLALVHMHMDSPGCDCPFEDPHARQLWADLDHLDEALRQLRDET